MKTAPAPSRGFVANFAALWRIRSNPRNTDFLHLFLTIMVWAAGFFLLSLALPDDIAVVLQNIVGWCVAGTVAALALVATAKVLEGLLDSDPS